MMINKIFEHNKQIINAMAKKPKEINKTLGKEIGNLISNSPQEIVLEVKEIGQKVKSLTQDAVELSKKQNDPISKTFNQFIKKQPEKNPVNIVNNIDDKIQKFVKNITTNVNDIKKETIKTVIKEESKHVIKNTWLTKIHNLIKYIKLYLQKLYK